MSSLRGSLQSLLVAGAVGIAGGRFLSHTKKFLAIDIYVLIGLYAFQNVFKEEAQSKGDNQRYTSLLTSTAKVIKR